MKIKYVGLKDEETAFSTETGITWGPGSSHEIPDALVKRMLAHPDVFALDEAQAKPTKVVATPSNPPAGEAPKFVMGTPDGPLVLDTMERDDLVALTKEADIKHHVNLGAEKLRALLVERFPPKAD